MVILPLLLPLLDEELQLAAASASAATPTAASCQRWRAPALRPGWLGHFAVRIVLISSQTRTGQRCSLSGLADGCPAQPLTEPTVSPAAIYRWAATSSMAAGSTPTTHSAIA